MAATAAGEKRALRRDAERNRGRLLAVAGSVFTEQGADASLEEVARRAGVGIGTLYRHFPSRQALIEAIFEERIGELVDAAEEAAAAEDAWTGLRTFLERTLEFQLANLALKDVLMQHPPGEGRLAELREQMRRLFERLLVGAQAQGSLRADFTVADLSVMFWSFGPVLEATAETAPRAWRRQLGFLLDGLRPDAATPPAEPALTDSQLAEATQRLRARRLRRRPSSAADAAK